MHNIRRINGLKFGNVCITTLTKNISVLVRSALPPDGEFHKTIPYFSASLVLQNESGNFISASSLQIAQDKLMAITECSISMFLSVGSTTTTTKNAWFRERGVEIKAIG